MLKNTLAALAIGTALLSAGQVMAADYKIDKEGQHAFIDWKISHLGYSFIHGTFKDWDVRFHRSQVNRRQNADVTGDLTFHGVTKPVTFKATFNGEGKDPWGGERAGFNAKTTVNLNDFGIKGPGPSSQTVDLDISLEGVKQK
ncbi:yceI-like domain-containing protein [Ditylenchus destructor]|nr:yceI-like domain-containing protein [Ditylenchus destructor]